MPTNQETMTPAQSSNENSAQNPTPQPSPALIAAMKQRATPEASNDVSQKMIEAWQITLNFYGAVIDEKTNPVEGANATFQWMETPTKGGERKKIVTSDANGRFSLEGQHGPSLSVSVSKAGYYSSRGDTTGFSYADLTSEKNASSFLDPIIFHLRKKGQGAELITSQNGMQPNVSVLAPRDNTPVQVDLLQKKADTTGQLEISQFKPPFQGATNWSFRISISDGGLIENQDDFQFVAPEFGYQPTVEYDFEKGATNWTTQVTKQFYIAFGNPRKYGWLRIESNLGQETVFLTYAINPDGTQNLEPMEAQPPHSELPPGVTEVIPQFK